MPDLTETTKAAEAALRDHAEHPAADRIRNVRRRLDRAAADLVSALRLADEVLDRRGAVVHRDSVRGRIQAAISQIEGR